MKSKMPAYPDRVGSSQQKLYSVLRDWGSLEGFSSPIRDRKTAALSEEIAGYVAAQIDRYVADQASEAVDQVSGRIQMKLDSLGESGVSVSDDAIEKIKKALAGDDSGGGIAQKVAEVLNGFGSKLSGIKDFLLGRKEEEEKEEEEQDGQSAFPDEDLFVKFIDEVMPDVKFFSERFDGMTEFA